MRRRSFPLVAEPGEELDRAEMVVMDALCLLGCTVPVDPYDADDCASVAVEAVRALRAAGWTLDDQPARRRLGRAESLVRYWLGWEQR